MKSLPIAYFIVILTFSCKDQEPFINENTKPFDFYPIEDAYWTYRDSMNIPRWDGSEATDAIKIFNTYTLGTPIYKKVQVVTMIGLSGKMDTSEFVSFKYYPLLTTSHVLTHIEGSNIPYKDEWYGEDNPFISGWIRFDNATKSLHSLSPRDEKLYDYKMVEYICDDKGQFHPFVDNIAECSEIIINNSAFVKSSSLFTYNIEAISIPHFSDLPFNIGNVLINSGNENNFKFNLIYKGEVFQP